MAKQVLAIIFALTTTSLAASNELSPQKEFIQEIQAVEDAYSSNIRIDGVYTRFENGEKKDSMLVEYSRLGERRRLLLWPITDESIVNKKGVKHIIVSSPDTSFFVTQSPDGQEEVSYVSPRRGMGMSEVAEVMEPYIYLVDACCSFLGKPTSLLSQEGQLIFEDTYNIEAEITHEDGQGGSVPEKIWLDIAELYAPENLVSENFSHFEGKLLVIPSQSWCIEKWQLHRVFKDSSPSTNLDIEICYSDTSGPPPLIQEVAWKSKLVNQSFDIEDLQFGVVKENDFTISGCGISILDMSGSHGSLPRIFLYACTVFIVCVLMLYLIRKRSSQE